MMANSFIDRLFPQQAQFGSPNITEGTAFDHWKGRGTSAEEWKPKLGETPHGTPAGQLHPDLAPTFEPKQVLTPAFDPTLVLASQGTEPATTTSLAKDDSRFSGDADTVVVTTIKETIANIKKCISAGEYDDAMQCVWTLRGLVMGYTDFKCGVICALKDSKK